jgi:hypothetical protein
MMKLVKLAAMGLVVAIIAAPMPAWAAFCANEGPQAPQTLEDRDGKGVLVTDTEAQASLDKQRLREAGIAATSAERWNGCIRAFVVQADGSRAMEIYDPASLRRLQ